MLLWIVKKGFVVKWQHLQLFRLVCMHLWPRTCSQRVVSSAIYTPRCTAHAPSVDCMYLQYVYCRCICTFTPIATSYVYAWMCTIYIYKGWYLCTDIYICTCYMLTWVLFIMLQQPWTFEFTACCPLYAIIQHACRACIHSSIELHVCLTACIQHCIGYMHT